MYDLKSAIKDGIQYTGRDGNDPDMYYLSASMVGKEPLQNYLSIIHGTIEEERLGDMALGSIFHMGMEQVMKIKRHKSRDDLFIEHEMSHQLSNGWMITGTADLIVKNVNQYEIHDYKLAKAYTVKMFKKEKANHPYTRQLQTLDYLLQKEMDIDSSAHCFVDFFVKDTAIAKGEEALQSEQIWNKNIDTMEEELIQQTNQLQHYIENAIIPPICKDTWIRKVRGATHAIPTRCAYYCSFKDVCPHYNQTSKMSAELLVGW